MRPLEALLTGALVVSLAMRWLRPRGRQASSTILAMIGIFAALHLFFDRPRWEMTPAYLMALAAFWILSSDLRRASGTKAGESARFAAIPSAAQRAGTGALLALGAVASVTIPAWTFPRVVLPEPDGLYHVGRIDQALADSARPLPSGAPRPVALSAWYPAEAPNGRRLRYHPHAGALGRYLAAGTPLPGFAFSNLTAARTWSTAAPRFSVREGRSPLVVVLQDTGASRMQGTALFERLASHGYVVISVDHAGGAAAPTAVEGVLQTWPPAPSDREARRDIEDRVADARLVLDRINRLPSGSLLDSLATHIRLDRVAVIGTGLGATAAAELAVLDERVTAGVALVPDTIGVSAARGLRRPFLVFTVGDPGDLLGSALRYGGTEVRLEGTTAPALADVALVGSPIVGLLGITSEDAPRRVHAAVSALTLRFLDQYLKERREQTEVEMPSAVRVRVIPHQPRAN